MKKNIRILLVLIISFYILIPSIDAKTLGDLKSELNDLEESLNDSNNQKEELQNQINNDNIKISEITSEIAEITQTKIYLQNEIESLNDDIVKKEAEMNSVISYIQISNGESAYLEYIFGASSFTDFIYRLAIAEQMVAYNDTLIDDYNNLIEENNNKKTELAETEIKLDKKREELQEEIVSLNNQVSGLEEGELDLESQIKAQKEVIKTYEDLGCKDNESIDTCGSKSLILATGVYRPITAGYITDEFGYRPELSGVTGSSSHTGIDMALSGSAVPVYPIASGVVVATSYHNSCGGNIIYVHHNINGTTYTSVYMHLRNIYVSAGDRVTPETVIATMGGDRSTEYWDYCSTGQHLHLSLLKGLYLKDYSDSASYKAHLINPRSLVNFPVYGGYFKDRTTKY